MESHGLDLKGNFKGERLSTLPAWVAADEGREIYTEDTAKRYYGSDTEWVDYYPTITLADVSDVTATATEVNTVADGATAKNSHSHLLTSVSDVTLSSNQLNSINKIWTYENVAPTGWAIIAGSTDGLLACKGGSQAYSGTGGTQVGTWTQTSHTHTGPNHTHAGPSHTHTVLSHTHAGPNHTHTGPNHRHTGPNHTHNGGSHSLSIAELAAHTHTITGYVQQGPGPGSVQDSISGPETSQGTSANSTGSGAAHSHGSTSAGGTGWSAYNGTGATSSAGATTSSAAGAGSTSSAATAATYRPYARVGMLAQKD